jgi:hypothetical protein
MMFPCYIHHWDEREYFKRAVPHAEEDPKVAGVKAGRNACDAPQQSSRPFAVRTTETYHAFGVFCFPESSDSSFFLAYCMVAETEEPV